MKSANHGHKRKPTKHYLKMVSKVCLWAYKECLNFNYISLNEKGKKMLSRTCKYELNPQARTNQKAKLSLMKIGGFWAFEPCYFHIENCNT